RRARAACSRRTAANSRPPPKSARAPPARVYRESGVHKYGSDPQGQTQRLRDAEVGLADVFVLFELLGVVGEGDRAGLEDIAAAGDVERHQRVLLDEQDRRPLRVDLADD